MSRVSRYLLHGRGPAMVLVVALSLVLIGVTVVQAMGGTISGTVTAPGGGVPPVGTLVKLFEPGTESVRGQAEVDGGGAFSLGPVPNGVYVLKAIPPVASGLTQSLPLEVSVLNAPVSGLSLALTTPQIIGTVYAPDATTPVTATVRVIAGDIEPIQRVFAPGGSFAIGGLPDGGYVVQAEPATDDPFWASARQPVSVTSGVTQTISLTLTNAQLYGVTLGPQNQPLPGAIVHVVSRNPDGPRHSDVSSPAGFWAIGGLPAGDYKLLAQPPFDHKELVPPAPIEVTLPAGATNPYTLTFTNAPKIVEGTVKTNLEQPVENALVVARRVDRLGQAETLTAADGSYNLRLSGGLWALTVKPTDSTNPAHWVFPRPPQLVHFRFTDQPETKTQNFVVLVADAQVTGVVEMPGGGTPPFTVTVGLFNNEGIGRRTDIDGSGAFSLNVPHGGYKVVIHPHDPGYLGPVVEPIRLEPNQTLDLGTLILLAKDATITGTVRDGANNGVEGIPVTAWRAGSPDTLVTRTGPDGNYILPVAAGRWHVQPAPGPEQPYLYLGEGETVFVAAGQVAPDVDFELITADATINGQLVDQNGDRITDVNGWAGAVNTANQRLHNGAPIEDGFFSILVPAGNYNVAARLAAGAPYMSGAERNVNVAAGQTVTITLELKEINALIDGALVDRRAQAAVTGVGGFVGAWSEGNWAGTPINTENGAYRLPVAAGLWHLDYRIDPTANYVKLVEGKNVPVQSGQTVHVALPVFFKDGQITGSVLDPNGNPVGGIVVAAKAISPTIESLVLHTFSRPDGTFSLPVPYGVYRLGALFGGQGVIKPFEIEVRVPPNGVSGGHVLQFQLPDATISGNLTVSGGGNLTGPALVWAWSDDGLYVHGTFPVTNSTGTYSLDVISNTVWHIGGVFETSSQYWAARETVAVGSGDAVQDLTLTGPQPKPGPVVVTFDAANPQEIILADGTQIFIPAGAMAVSGRVILRVVPLAALPQQHHANTYKYGYAFLASDSLGQPIEESFNQDVVISFSYSDAELLALGIRENRLKPAYFSTTTDHWTIPDSYVVDTDRNIVTMPIDHFTDFALTAEGLNLLYLPVVAR